MQGAVTVKLQLKLVLMLSLIWLLLCAAIYGDAMFTLKHTYADQENALMVRDIERTQKAIQSHMQSLITYTMPWAQWDEAYAFMLTKNPEFIKMNFVPATFINDKLNFVIFYDTHGKFFYGEAYNLATNKKEALPQTLEKALSENPDFLHHHNTGSMKAGIINLPEGKVLMSSLPVVTSNGAGPSRGTLLMGRTLTQNDFNMINNVTSLQTQFIPLPATNNPVAEKALNNLKSKPYFIDDIDPNTAIAYMLIHSINQQPAYLAITKMTRSFYNEGLSTITAYLISLVLAGIVTTFTLWLLLKKQIIDRILKVKNDVSKIIEKGHFSETIAPSGRDEINELITSINQMLLRIDQTQKQLKQHLSKRTQELEQVSELNRNLFTEVGLHKNKEAELLKEEISLKKMAYFDSLTGLATRTFFLDKLSKAVEQCPRALKIALLFIDIDNFKTLNDAHGHAFGDAALKQIAQRLQTSLPPSATPGRLSGDELVVFMEHINKRSDLDTMVSELLKALSAPLVINNITITPTYSIGISIYPDDSEYIDDLLKKADMAMYHAKKEKKKEVNASCYYAESQTKKTPLTPFGSE